MSATELAVVMYAVSLQQKFDVLQQQVQQLHERVETLEGKSTRTDRELWSLQTGQAELQNSQAALQTRCTELRLDHEDLGYEFRFVLCQTLEDVADLKALVVADADHCEQLSLEDWCQRYTEAFE